MRVTPAESKMLKRLANQKGITVSELLRKQGGLDP